MGERAEKRSLGEGVKKMERKAVRMENCALEPDCRTRRFQEETVSDSF